MSARYGVHVVAGTGYYVTLSHPEHMASSSVAEFAAGVVTEFEWSVTREIARSMDLKIEGSIPSASHGVSDSESCSLDSLRIRTVPGHLTPPQMVNLTPSD